MLDFFPLDAPSRRQKGALGPHSLCSRRRVVGVSRAHLRYTPTSGGRIADHHVRSPVVCGRFTLAFDLRIIEQMQQ